MSHPHLDFTETAYSFTHALIAELQRRLHFNLIPENNVFNQLAEWMTRLTGLKKFPGLIPDSNPLWSCHNILKGGAMARVTEMALN